ncbi:SRPBCC domain-containing protein [Streptomyces phaeofaciens JCM 4814]|uniref:Activator of HSP90 ATPase n=1 Tax=Streptomyces phaeofaciens TaxID=68254 RepID=A0A918LW07_9ACTN|nr:SRPBCC domain-containing protein [Streptomyces phaeofaciens]GGT61607.1 activator of HSP90 ATPase [Streptomyces phaeofaciens]
MARDEGLVLRLRRHLPAAPPAVFRALTAPRELARWWGPDGFTIPDVTSDLRPGGAYRITMRPPDGDVFHLAGEFLDIDPPGLLRYTFRWEEPDPEDRETIVTLALRASEGASTELTLTQDGFATERRRALHEEGWTQSFAKLETLLPPG